ncbi:phosphoribosylaminoimidazole carboxylase ade2 [Pleurotus pulmonarius]|nr:phosphoribosylaminoimidazole carboxylase ade2 [Pleurotus pulmonarius]
MTDKVVGILGGGQLGRMLAASASLLNIKVVILDVGTAGPAKQVVFPVSPDHTHIDGSFADPDKIRELASKVSVLTVEIEHVDADALEAIGNANQSRLQIHPHPSTIKIIQDKLRQKEMLQSHQLPVAPFLQVDSTPESIQSAIGTLGLPLMVKSRTLAYDGRGNYVVRTIDQIPDAIKALGNRPLYVEKWMPFSKEVAVMVVRTIDGDVKSYPLVETIHKESICHLVFAPFRGVANRARAIAEDAVRNMSGAGIFGVEMFLMDDGEILINEIAPRPHNSGHYTIEACETSQYENHLRAILGLPLGSTQLKVPSTAMLNIIGASSSMSEITSLTRVALSIPGVSVHLYGKSECRKGRKMGHITIVGESDAQVRSRLRPLLEALPNGSPEETNAYAPAPPGPGSGFPDPHPLVGIIMGSDSDLPVMLPAARILDHFKVPYELTIVSAHRTPDRLVEYSRGAASRGLRVIIAGAGGAAHLPGMAAAMTPIPIIGVPVKGSSLDGVDSLHSIVQMPRGIPVATVAINNGVNAGLLAVRMLSVGSPSLLIAMEDYMKTMEKEVLEKVDTLAGVGWEKYVTRVGLRDASYYERKSELVGLVLIVCFGFASRVIMIQSHMGCVREVAFKRSTTNMKWLFSVVAFLAIQIVSASPVIEKRASVNDVANIGYATLNGGTSGGSGGTTTVVTSLSALTSAVSGSAKKVVVIQGTITGNTVVKVGPNTTIVGRGGSLVGVGLRVLDVSNVIIRNLKVSKVLASAGDAIVTCLMTNYDGLLDITHGCTGVTVTGSKLYDHYKGSLVGHSDSNASEDTKITVTYANNYFSNINSRTPSFRFGHGHLFNNVFENNNDGINTRVGAELLVENNVWTGTNKKPLYSTTGGLAVARGNDFGGGSNTAPTGSFTSAPYSYPLISTSSVVSSVRSSAGATLSL